jgi:hypothetical protein
MSSRVTATLPRRGSRAVARRRPPWLLVLGLLSVVLAAAAWSGFWYHMALKAERTVAAWREREAKLSRIFTCRSEGIGGYPFRVEVRCTDPSAELRNLQPALALTAKDLLVSARIYDATHLVSEFAGPLSMGELGHAPTMVASWSLAQTTVHGSPYAPDRASIHLEQPSLDRMTPAGKETVIQADRLDINGEIVGGTPTAHPIIEILLQLTNAFVPNWHPLAAKPTDAEVKFVLRGLPDFTAKSWPVRFKEMQQAGGRIDITSARLQQGDTIAVTSGILSLSPRGGLDGQLRVTVVGLDRILPALGLDRLVPPSANADRLAPALSALDRLAPGLGSAVRDRAGTGFAAGINAFGDQTQLEGKPAISLPLRFDDGAILLGPLPVGKVPPLF